MSTLCTSDIRLDLMRGMPTVVYYLLGPTVDGPLVKIGVTCDLRNRIRMLRREKFVTGPLRPLAVEVGGYYRLERSRHDRFRHLMVRSEWFRPEPELLLFIARLACTPDELAWALDPVRLDAAMEERRAERREYERACAAGELVF